jgi:glycerol-3-phosphate dehydrogenase
MLSVFGGKITTYRHLAEEAVDLLASRMPELDGGHWTDQAPLPGGDFAMDGAPALIAALTARYRFLEPGWAARLVHAYGTLAAAVLGDAQSLSDCGHHFGHGLTERELRYLVAQEWAMCAADVLWRRSKLGLRFSATETAVLEQWFAEEAE